MNHHKNPSIYALFVDEGVYCYVGSTSINSANRLWEHIYRARSGHTAPVYSWMRHVGIENVQVADLVFISDATQRKELEADLIKVLLDEGHPLTNRKSRDGVFDSMPEESRKLISKKVRGRTGWNRGKSGEEAGWTEERRAKQTSSVENRYEHGTEKRAKLKKCPCDVCESWRAANPSKPRGGSIRVDDIEHGRYKYKRDKCRCDVCVQANRDYSKAWAKSKKNQ